MKKETDTTEEIRKLNLLKERAIEALFEDEAHHWFYENDESFKINCMTIDDFKVAINKYSAQELSKVRAEYSERSLSEENKTVWLIENENGEWYFPQFYWEQTGGCTIGRTRALWLKDANSALKFTTEKEAREFADSYGRFEFEPVKITEHEFINAKAICNLVVLQESKPITKEQVIEKELLLSVFGWVSMIGEQFFNATTEDLIIAYKKHKEQ